MLDALVAEYRESHQLYLSWDAASWHVSKRLFEHIDAHNASIGSNGPQIDTASLPARAQFLNVIESVFSGMARAISLQGQPTARGRQALGQGTRASRVLSFKQLQRPSVWINGGGAPLARAPPQLRKFRPGKTEGSLCTDNMTAIGP
nr:hypothetical protein [Bradyrhizobium elkanii]